MAAPAQKIWDLIADIRNTGRFSPETFEAEWLDGATGRRSAPDSADTSGATRSVPSTGRCAR
ncbi:polyketide cyclase / dehydrase and lipid transport family protein [Mycobacterium kansasii]|uniref:Polyketide cyclase / dehydrase and lipid transport family protein n=1 Tax=Mycobacterium kansasii TaxID=1768 RepID=A0A1V3X4W5_MYCKA|nr:polyketide cyclase / dehydrase and lipid transport family protein [Mycobacterium kansasii]